MVLNTKWWTHCGVDPAGNHTVIVTTDHQCSDQPFPRSKTDTTTQKLCDPFQPNCTRENKLVEVALTRSRSVCNILDPDKSSWQHASPTLLSVFQPDCGLHIHLSFSANFGIRPPLSEKNAPGIIIAHGSNRYFSLVSETFCLHELSCGHNLTWKITFTFAGTQVLLERDCQDVTWGCSCQMTQALLGNRQVLSVVDISFWDSIMETFWLSFLCECKCSFCCRLPREPICTTFWIKEEPWWLSRRSGTLQTQQELIWSSV